MIIALTYVCFVCFGGVFAAFLKYFFVTKRFQLSKYIQLNGKTKSHLDNKIC